MARTELIRLDAAVVEGARVAAYLTASEFRARAGLSERTAWLARSGQLIGLGSAKRVAEALGVTLDALVPVDRPTPARRTLIAAAPRSAVKDEH